MVATNFEQFPEWVAQLHKLGLEWVVQRRGEGGKYNITRRECGSLREELPFLAGDDEFLNN